MAKRIQKTDLKTWAKSMSKEFTRTGMKSAFKLMKILDSTHNKKNKA